MLWPLIHVVPGQIGPDVSLLLADVVFAQEQEHLLTSQMSVCVKRWHSLFVAHSFDCASSPSADAELNWSDLWPFAFFLETQMATTWLRFSAGLWLCHQVFDGLLYLCLIHLTVLTLICKFWSKSYLNSLYPGRKNIIFLAAPVLQWCAPC